MLRITERQRELLTSKVVPISNKDTDYYAWGRNTRIVLGDNNRAVQNLLIAEAEAGRMSEKDVDTFFEGYWYGIEPLIAQLPEESVVIEVKIKHEGMEWVGELDLGEDVLLSVKDAIKSENDPIKTVSLLVRRGHEYPDEPVNVCYTTSSGQLH